MTKPRRMLIELPNIMLFVCIKKKYHIVNEKKNDRK